MHLTEFIRELSLFETLDGTSLVNTSNAVEPLPDVKENRAWEHHNVEKTRKKKTLNP